MKERASQARWNERKLNEYIESIIVIVEKIYTLAIVKHQAKQVFAGDSSWEHDTVSLCHLSL